MVCRYFYLIVVLNKSSCIEHSLCLIHTHPRLSSTWLGDSLMPVALCLLLQVGCLGIDVVDRHFKRVKEITSLNNTVTFFRVLLGYRASCSSTELKWRMMFVRKWSGLNVAFLCLNTWSWAGGSVGKGCGGFPKCSLTGVGSYKWEFKLHNPPCFLLVLGS